MFHVCSRGTRHRMLPIRRWGFWFLSLVDDPATAFLEGLEKVLGGERPEEGWWCTLMESASRIGENYSTSWRTLQGRASR